MRGVGALEQASPPLGTYCRLSHLEARQTSAPYSYKVILCSWFYALFSIPLFQIVRCNLGFYVQHNWLQAQIRCSLLQAPITSLLPSFQEPLRSARQEVNPPPPRPVHVEELLQAHLPLKVAVWPPTRPVCPPGLRAECWVPGPG